MTIYTSNPGWIPQPGRITRSWPSGLVLLQQEFVGRIEIAGHIAVPGDPFPVDDAGTGAKVYSIPEYRDIGNGFQSATVSAYGIAPGGSGPKIETLGADMLLSGLKFLAEYENDGLSGGTSRLGASRNVICETVTIVSCGRGELVPITSKGNVELKVFYNGTDLAGRVFTSREIFIAANSFTDVNVTASVSVVGPYDVQIQYFGDIWEQRVTFGAAPQGIDFGMLQPL